MGIKQIAVAAALGAAVSISASALAQETVTPMTRFFVAIPLDARNAKEQVPNFGLQFQGSRPYQSVKIDYQTFRLLPAAAAGLEMKYIVAGAVAVGAAVATTHKSKSEQAQSQQFAQQQQQQKEACPTQVC
jgi:hypothetical protein